MIYKTWIRPILFRCAPEKVHNYFLKLGNLLGKNEVIERFFRYEHSMLSNEVLGQTFKNPVGLAAGFDKNGTAIDFLSTLGFGFIEIGSVTTNKHSGNSGKTIVRMEKEESLFNNIGLENKGIFKVKNNLDKRISKIIVGANIASPPYDFMESTTKDFLYSSYLLQQSSDYITLNMSCPSSDNIPLIYWPERIEEVLSHVNAISKKPLLLKISPDLSNSELETILELGESYELTGYVVANSMPENFRNKRGGLSGKAIKNSSTNIIEHLYPKIDVPIIGCGGISTAKDAFEKILAGATLVQLYTGLVYEGISVVRNIKKGLVELIKKEGYSNIQDAVGQAHQQF
jgi:dihydroorotate dehydrogenase